MSHDGQEAILGALPLSLVQEEEEENFMTLPVLHHGRDVHPTWVKSSTETLSNKGLGVLSARAKSEEDFDSY